MNETLAALHARNVADVNARTVAAGRCVMHNSDVNIPAVYLWYTLIGNIVPVCVECCAWMRENAAETPDDPYSQPVRITDL